MNNLLIAICDDDKLFQKNIEKIIFNFFNMKGIKCFIDFFESGEDMLTKSKYLLKYSVIFLDVLMDGLNGISTAHKIRSLGATASIVFISGVIESAPAGYEVSAFRYILKNQFLNENLNRCLQILYDKLLATNDVFSDKKYNNEFSIKLSNILYFESQLRKILLYYYQENNIKLYEFYGKIIDLEHQYCKKGFLRVHKGYLINMQHTEKLTHDSIFLTDGKQVPISSKRYKDVKKRYLLWKAGYKDDFKDFN